MFDIIIKSEWSIHSTVIVKCAMIKCRRNINRISLHKVLIHSVAAKEERNAVDLEIGL